VVNNKKEKKKKVLKSNLEKQYEEFFTFCEKEKLFNNVQTIHKISPQQQLETWVTYGAFEDPIF